MSLHLLYLLSQIVLAGTLAAQDGPPINQTPPVVVSTIELADWTFTESTAAWQAENNCRLTHRDGLLAVEATAEDPFFHRDVRDMAGASGELKLVLRARAAAVGEGAIYWATTASGRSEDQRQPFRLIHDQKWHTYEVPFTANADLIDLRIDPGTAAGRIEFESIRLIKEALHPLRFERLRQEGGRLAVELRNAGDVPRAIHLLGQDHLVPPHATVSVVQQTSRQEPFESIALHVASPDLPDLRRTVCVHHTDVAIEDPMERDLGDHSLQIARDGSLARFERDGRLVGYVGPLVVVDGQVPQLELVEAAASEVVFRCDAARVVLTPAADQLRVRIESRKPCEGPVVCAVGPVEQGLLSGVEYLGRGEKSSTRLDVETDSSYRFAPDPLHVTMPLMAFVTGSVSLALTWDDMTLQPTFATPNFVDATDDHRMSLKGHTIDAVVHLAAPSLEKTILTAVQRRGLPPLPPAPRDSEQQRRLCLDALETGPLRTPDGWGHCAEPNWGRQPYADMASTIWRLSGQVPQLERLVRGGSHVANDAAYFVTGRADQWLEERRAEVRGLIAAQQPDGSYRYSGPYQRGHFEDTASGQCGLPALKLLEFARWTGDQQALETGLKTLDFMRRFRTPRGAQVWEVPLHTPDLLASAHLVGAYTIGYELTGDGRYLDDARRWAASGLPFVYQWSCRPVMAYATTPVFGATHWKAPLWIGLPVQWVGVVYACELVRFAPYDKSLDWNHVARGILTAAEQMQYPDGSYAGLLPDAFRLASQERVPASINPCSLVSLERALAGQLDGLAVARHGEHVVVSPFPARIVGGEVQIDGRENVRYEVLIDGRRIVAIESRGRDLLSLDGSVRVP